MMGEQSALFYEFSLERHVPAVHILLAIDGFVQWDATSSRATSPATRTTPRRLGVTIAHNDLKLYNTARGPEEIVNLAALPEAQRDLILHFNAITKGERVPDGQNARSPAEN